APDAAGPLDPAAAPGGGIPAHLGCLVPDRLGRGAAVAAAGAAAGCGHAGARASLPDRLPADRHARCLPATVAPGLARRARARPPRAQAVDGRLDPAARAVAAADGAAHRGQLPRRGTGRTPG